MKARSAVRSLGTRIRHPRTTVRWRLTLLYGGLFLACGAGLLVITYALVAHAPVTLPKATFTRAPPNQAAQLLAQQLHLRRKIPAQIARALRSPSGPAFVQDIGTGQRIVDLHQLEVESAIALAIMAVLSGALGWLVAGRVLRPLRTMTAATQQISEVNLHERLAVPGPRDELRQLADTIDGLLTRLEAAFDAQRQFVANASHELRTPLTSARALLEMVLEDPRATIDSFRISCRHVLEENEQQEQLIDALLALAQSQRGLERREPVDLSGLLAEELRRYEPQAAEHGLELETDLTPAHALGDRRLMARLVSNLLSNAILHNAPGGLVSVIVGVVGEQAVLRVANTGPVVPVAEVERLREPFQRLTQARAGHGNGLGLGLSIATAVATAHGARLEIRPRAAGGLEVELRLAACRISDAGNAFQLQNPQSWVCPA